MGEEKKITQATAKSVNDWVGAYYGDDAIDMSKANKIKHLIGTAQFASVVYVVSKNTKLAHTDLSDATYTTVDTRYAKAAEIVIRLLHKKYKDGNRPLTATDFEDCGGREFFGGAPNYDQICQDYIKPGGMVDTAQSVLPVYESDEGNAKCYGRIVEDMDKVKRDHSYLLTVTGSKGSLTREQIFNIYDSTTDASTKIWKKLKDAKSGGEFDLQKQMEDAYLLKYDLAKQTAKVGIVLGGAAYALGAMAGGLIFVPALVALGSYALGKKWLPDYFKALGTNWGAFEKRHQTRRKIKRAIAHMDWLVRAVENGGKKPKMTLSDLMYVRKADIDVLKKQGKVLGFSSIELSDGKTHDGEAQQAKIAAAAGLGEFSETKDMVTVDTKDVLEKRIKSLDGANVTIENFHREAAFVKEVISSLPITDRQDILTEYSKKLLECAQSLVFRTDFETGTDYQDKISKYFSDEMPILGVLKDFDPNTVEKVKRYVTFASKELTGLGGSYIGGSLENYIQRVPQKKLDMDQTGLIFTKNVDGKVTTYDLSTYGNIQPVVNALGLINLIKLNPSDDRKFIVEGTNLTINDITKEIAKITPPNGASDADIQRYNKARDLCSEVLDQQMKTVTFSKSREDSRKVYESILQGGFGGKLDLSKIFEEFKNIKYDNVDTAAPFYVEMGKMEPKETREYLRGKLSKHVFDQMDGYVLGHADEFKADMKTLSACLRKINASPYLNEEQKKTLSSKATGIIKESFLEEIKNLPKIFMEKYDYQHYVNLLGSFASGGFEEVFIADQSTETQGVKKGIEYMIDVDNIHSALKFNNSFNIPASEGQYIAKTYLLNMASGGDYPRIRDPKDDGLRVFIENHIKSMKTSFGYVEPTQLTSSPTFNELESAYTYIMGQNAGDPSAPDYKAPMRVRTDTEENKFNDLHDKYAALLILKNKAVSLYRTYMSEYLGRQYKGSSDSKSVWLDQNIDLIDGVKQAWNDYMGKIDAALQAAEFQGLAGKVSKYNATDEFSRYRDGQEVWKTVGSAELGA